MMARKRQYYKKRLRAYPVVLLILASAASLVASLLGLRANYLGASPLLTAIFEADQTGGNTELALYNLRTYTHSHMNVDLRKMTGARPPIQLKNKYEQLTAAEKKRVALTNEIILKEGEAVCGQRFTTHEERGKKTACVQQYQLEKATKEIAIPDSLYKFDCVSPRWSYDIAGICLLLFILSTTALVIRLVVGIAFRLQVRGNG